MPPTPLNPLRWYILLAAICAFLPVIIDMTVLHVAAPVLTQSLKATSIEILWILDIYPLLMAGLLVPMGTLADRIGNRRLILTGLLVFGVASVMAAYSPSAVTLIASRALLAVGGAMIVPCILGVISRTFDDDKERALALGLWGTIASAGAAFGPLIAGGLLEYFWWGSVFLINVPIMLLVAPACYFLLPRHEVRTDGTWPIMQAVPLIIGMISLVYAMKAGFGGYQPVSVASAFAGIGAVLLAVFVRQQLQSRNPMLDLSLFSHPAIVAGIIMAVFSSGIFAGVNLTLIQELQYVVGKTPLEAGLYIMPIMVASAVGGPMAGYFSNQFGLRRVATVSLLLGAGSLLGLGFVDFHHAGVLAFGILGFFGLVMSIGLTASSIAIMNSVDPEKSSAAGSLESTGFELGAGLGISIFGVLMALIYGHRLVIPSVITDDLAHAARLSIGDTFVVAQGLPSEISAGLLAAGKDAFNSAYITLLFTTGIMLCALAALVCYLLTHYKPRRNSH